MIDSCLSLRVVSCVCCWRICPVEVVIDLCPNDDYSIQTRFFFCNSSCSCCWAVQELLLCTFGLVCDWLVSNPVLFKNLSYLEEEERRKEPLRRLDERWWCIGTLNNLKSNYYSNLLVIYIYIKYKSLLYTFKFNINSKLD